MARGNEDLPFWELINLSKAVAGVEAEACVAALL